MADCIVILYNPTGFSCLPWSPYTDYWVVVSSKRTSRSLICLLVCFIFPSVLSMFGSIEVAQLNTMTAMTELLSKYCWVVGSCKLEAKVIRIGKCNPSGVFPHLHNSKEFGPCQVLLVYLLLIEGNEIPLAANYLTTVLVSLCPHFSSVYLQSTVRACSLSYHLTPKVAFLLFKHCTGAFPGIWLSNNADVDFVVTTELSITTELLTYAK